MVSPPRLILLFSRSSSSSCPEFCFISACCTLCKQGGHGLGTGCGAMLSGLFLTFDPFWARRREKGSPPSRKHLKRCQGSRCSKGFQVKLCPLALKSDFSWVSSLCLRFHIYKKKVVTPFTYWFKTPNTQMFKVYKRQQA